MAEKMPERGRKGIALTALTTRLGPVAASISSTECSTPESLEPLMTFIDTIDQLAFTAGIGIDSIGILVAGILFMWPGEDSSRRAKQVLKNTLIGAVILLSSNAVLAFMTTQLGGSMC